MFDIQLLVLKIVQNLGERHNARIETVFSIKITRNVVLSFKDSPKKRQRTYVLICFVFVYFFTKMYPSELKQGDQEQNHSRTSFH